MPNEVTKKRSMGLTNIQGFFIFYEYKKGEFDNGYAIHGSDGVLTDHDLTILEEELLKNRDYKGAMCNIINHKPFESDIDAGYYLIRYFVDGDRSLRRTDIGYEGGIETFDDILFIQEVISENVEKLDGKGVLVADFVLIDEIDPRELKG